MKQSLYPALKPRPMRVIYVSCTSLIELQSGDSDGERGYDPKGRRYDYILAVKGDVCTMCSRRLPPKTEAWYCLDTGWLYCTDCVHLMKIPDTQVDVSKGSFTELEVTQMQMEMLALQFSPLALGDDMVRMYELVHCLHQLGYGSPAKEYSSVDELMSSVGVDRNTGGDTDG